MSSNTNNSSNDDDTIPLTQYSLALELKSHPVRGRGVFAREPLDRNVLVEISPILFFNAEEYTNYGKYTVLDQYTYCWQGGFALALGLGSMFNHNSSPNVGFIRDIPNKLIRYVTLRRIEKYEELCISYGNHLWFEDESNVNTALSDSDDEPFPFQDSSSEEDQGYL
ncbi:hypothetical protein [Parasitella parasitica]|uniref:SET domain-containing protein n=1 Tax=Parasitella parasitica TaxID=35722 RepID=A0A0B7N0A4_9FUNG|nr:hypothetical protein [Parasitella parasitica]